MLQSGMAPGKVGDRKAGPAVAPATFQNKAAQEGSRSGNRSPPNRSTLSLPQHLLRTQRRIALLDHLPVMCCVAHRVVQEIAANNSHPGSFVHRDRFMDEPFTPVSAL